MKFRFQNQKNAGSRAQAIVEFAIVLPILLMLLFGILEVGRMIFTYAAVTNASREAVRFGSAVGLDDDGLRHYNNCPGIRAVAKRSAYFMNLENNQIEIRYDSGPGTALRVPNCDGTDIVSAGDRVRVRITTTYRPLVRLVPIGEKPIESVSARTIVGIVNLMSGSGSVPGGGTGSSATRTPTPTPTATQSGPTPTNTPTATPTPTNTVPPGDWATNTLFPTFTPTNTLQPTNTPTNTPTATPTYTPTSTPTVMPGCGSISSVYSNIKGATTMSLSVTNPHDAFSVAGFEVTWNATSGGPGSKALALASTSLGNSTWNWNPAITTSPYSYTFTSPYTVTIPGNNRTSILTFTFNNPYQNKGSTDKIVLTLASEQCGTFSITKP
jgi:Flp pilus assembly protein TadG